MYASNLCISAYPSALWSTWSTGYLGDSVTSPLPQGKLQPPSRKTTACPAVLKPSYWNLLPFPLFFFFFLKFGAVFFFKFYFIFKLYKIVLFLPNIKMNPPQVYMCSPSWTLLPPPSPYHPSGSSQCTSPKHPVSCVEPGQSLSHFQILLGLSSSRKAITRKQICQIINSPIA